MKAHEIRVGDEYYAKGSGTIVPVRVDSIGSEERFGRWCDTYKVTSLVTFRKLKFRSAQKFRYRVKVAD